MGLGYRLLKEVLFRLDAESTHERALDLAARVARRRWLCGLVSWMYRYRDLALHTRALGADFPNPLGLAAGFDKDARIAPTMAALGFGHVEVGSVLAEPWGGNPRPRIFRLPEDRALINRLGLPSAGARAACHNLGRTYPGIPVGGNVARAGPVPGNDPDKGIAQIVDAAREMARVCTYLTLNASCPNTEDGRSLQDPGMLRTLLQEVARVLPAGGRRVPFLVKLSPDLEDAEVEALGHLALEEGAAGLLCGNTTRSRDELATAATRVDAIGAGGLSGHPLLARTLRRVARLRRALGPEPVLVACGGLATGRDVYLAMRAGADLAQIYTALVYRGPEAPGRICRELAAELRKVGALSVDAIKGLDA